MILKNVLVETSPRMPKSNGSVVGAGAPVPLPAPVPRMGSNREMTTPLLGPPTPPYRK